MAHPSPRPLLSRPMGRWVDQLWLAARIDDELDPPVAAAARFTVITVIVTAVAVSAYCLVTAVWDNGGPHLYAVALAYVGACAGAFLLVRNRHIQFATHIVVLVNCSAAVYFLISEGPETKHVGIFFIAVIAAGWLARPVAAVGYGLASAAAIAAANIAASRGLYAGSDGISESAWLQPVSQIVAAGALVGFLVRSLHRALAELRANQSKLLDEARERQALEAELLRAQKTQSLGRLAAGVAHDFNNFLTVILMNSSALKSDVSLDEATRGHLEEVEEAALKAAAVTRQLLAFGSKSVGAPRVVDLRDVLKGIERMSIRLLGEGVAFSLTLAERPLLVHAAPVQLEQIAVNLVVNAQDAMPAGGALTIVADALELGVGRAAELELGPGPWVRLEVRDTGVGIPPEHAALIFEPFFTTKADGHGTGLGLSTVAMIVSQLGGHILVGNNPQGSGTTFALYLPPAAPETEAESPNPATEVPGARPAGVVCLVDDDPAVRRVVERALTLAGYRVIAADAAASAMVAIEEAGVEPNILLTDVVLREGSGAEVASEFRKRFAGRPVLFMSAYSGRVLAGYGIFGRDAELLSKPFTPDDLVKRIGGLLETAQPE